MGFEQLFVQCPFAFIVRRKGGMPALTSQHAPTGATDRNERCHADTRPGAGNEDRFAAIILGVTGMDHAERAVRQFGNGAGHGGIIIDQLDAFQVAHIGKPPRIHRPVAIGELDHTVFNRPCNRNQRLFGLLVTDFLAIGCKREVEAFKVVAGHDGHIRHHRMTGKAAARQGKSNIGAPNIANENRLAHALKLPGRKKSNRLPPDSGLSALSRKAEKSSRPSPCPEMFGRN